MKNIKLLDCTLRDGGRIIDCEFSNNDICKIASKLAKSRIDIIEMGFLRDWRTTEYSGDSTFFTATTQLNNFIDKKENEIYTVFADYGMFDFNSLENACESKIDGIRVGFTKKDLSENKDDIIRSFMIAKDKGYKLFVQGVNSLGYSDKEFLEVIEIINEIHPYSFGMVDTYGGMYIDDVQRIYGLIDHNLDDDICINFHSHNNFQLSFSFAQEVIRLSRGKRNIIIDSTLNGMGKCAGNLNTELIVDYMNRKLGYNYNFDTVLDLIDDYIYKYKERYDWGYSIPAFMAGVYKSHPNNIIYLTEKMRLSSKDIKYILSMITPEIRQRYDYDNIKELYKKYNHTKVDDQAVCEEIKKNLENRDVLLIFPGYSLREEQTKVISYIEKNSPYIISVNFIPDFIETTDWYVFFGSEKRYELNINDGIRFIITSNIKSQRDTDLIINYESVINRDNEDFDNTGIMLFNLLKKIGITRFVVAGFDGFNTRKQNYINSNSFGENRYIDKFTRINENLYRMLKDYSKSIENKTNIKFITESIFKELFEDDTNA